MSERDFIFKICICGDFAVGKTSLIKQYIEKQFEKEYKPTLGCDLFRSDIDIEQDAKKIHCRLVFWDIAGQEKYLQVRPLYFQGCRGALMVYDTTRLETFQNITDSWLKDFKGNVREDTSYILIGNKTDLEESRLVSTDEGKELAKKINATKFIETSAKTGDKVKEAFKSLVIAILKQFGEIR